MSLFELSHWPPWVVMWAIAAGLFAICKWLTWARTIVPGASKWRQFAYWFAWPGLDAKAFFDPRPIPRERRPSTGEWVFAFVKFALGVALVCGVVRLVPAELPFVRAWVGMAGVVFLLHFGTFHLLSCAWRTCGVDAKPIMNWPLVSESVSEFWRKRWNLAFRDLAYRFLFRPLTARFGALAGLAGGFLVSGIAHELVISVPARGGYGLPTLYFVIQGLGMLVERSKFGKRAGLGEGWRGHMFTALVVIGPAAALFHPPFVREVVLPFLEAIGAY
ncbi:MAG: membrane bound O-acyl transferase family-domain-containing protein [Planctomycetia bacterium]|nr:membrane bound O-acyl transferase family-domain-containing protein [Planctomycetia bacterium]